MENIEDIAIADKNKECLLDLHLRRGRVVCPSSATSDGNDSIVGRCTGRVRHEIDQRHLSRCAALIYSIYGCVDICREIRYLGQVASSYYFSHDKGRVVDGSNRPLGAIFNLTTWWWCEGIVVRVLTTDVEQRPREAISRHCHRPVDGPKACAKRIRYSCKTGTRCGVGLEHHERLPILQSKRRRIDVGLDKIGIYRVAQKVAEDGLRILRRSEIGVFSCTVVGRISKKLSAWKAELDISTNRSTARE